MAEKTLASYVPSTQGATILSFHRDPDTPPTNPLMTPNSGAFAPALPIGAGMAVTSQGATVSSGPTWVLAVCAGAALVYIAVRIAPAIADRIRPAA